MYCHMDTMFVPVLVFTCIGIYFSQTVQGWSMVGCVYVLFSIAFVCKDVARLTTPMGTRVTV